MFVFPTFFPNPSPLIGSILFDRKLIILTTFLLVFTIAAVVMPVASLDQGHAVVTAVELVVQTP